MPDGDLLIGNDDFFDQKSQYALTFGHIKGIGRGPQSSKEGSQRLCQAQAGCTLERLIDDGLQLGLVRLLAPPQPRHPFAKLVQREKTFLESGKQTLDALSDAHKLTSQGLFSPLGWISLTRSR